MILLDTQAVVWFFEGSDRLGLHARSTIDQAVYDHEAYVAPILFLDVATLHRRSRLTLVTSVRDWAAAVLAACRLADMTAEIAIDAGSLPEEVHGDPADRVMIATARIRQCPLLTSDRKILSCAQGGLLQAIDARR